MNWKLWIATPLTLGLGLWFAHAVIPDSASKPRVEHNQVESPACADRAQTDTMPGPTLASRIELCDHEVE